MRYLIQFVIPALIFLGVVYAVTRRKRHPNHEQDDGAAVFLTILVIGAWRKYSSWHWPPNHHGHPYDAQGSHRDRHCHEGNR